MQTNRDVYGSVEFDAWAGRADIDAAEGHLLRNYLNPSGCTVEAGTGGGRLLLSLADLGFSQLFGYDYVPQLLFAAQAKDSGRRLKLSAQDATQLAYADGSFDQIIYLQQVICMIENAQSRRQAMSEAYRILRPGGVALFSFLSHDVRSHSLPYRLFSNYLQAYRWLRGVSRTRQTWPWLRLGGRFNFASLIDAGPYVYWYRAEEAVHDLQGAGFTLKGVGSGLQVEAGMLCENTRELMATALRGGLYCVCSK